MPVAIVTSANGDPIGSRLKAGLPAAEKIAIALGFSLAPTPAFKLGQVV